MSKAVSTFNGLNGKFANTETLKKVKKICSENNRKDLAERLEAAIEKAPENETFRIKLKEPAIEEKKKPSENTEIRSMIDLRKYRSSAKTKKAIEKVEAALKSEASKVASAKLQWENDLKKLKTHLSKFKKKKVLNGSWHAKDSKYRNTTDENQKLKPGYKFKKGGAIKKTAKPKKASKRKLAEEVDLFETPEKIPAKVRKVLKPYEDQFDEGLDYNDLKQMQKDVEAVGYTFEFGLDASPYGLKKLPKPSAPQKKKGNPGSTKKKRRPTTEELRNKIQQEKDIRITSFAELEKQLKKLGFEIFGKEGNYKSKEDFSKTYQLNFKDVAGATLQMDYKKGQGDFKLSIFGTNLEDTYADYDDRSVFFEAVYDELKETVKPISLNELSKLKKDYDHTLFGKKATNQLALLGAKKKPQKKRVVAGTPKTNLKGPRKTGAEKDGLLIRLQKEGKLQKKEPNHQEAAPSFTGEATPPSVSVKSNSRVYKAQDIANMHFESIEFEGKWKNLLQHPAKNMKLAIWGKPKNGKTAGSMQLAAYLTNFGSVLYNVADQGVNKSTQDLIKLTGLDTIPNAFISTSSNPDHLEEDIKELNPDFVFVDMINDHIANSGIKHNEFKERFVKGYPNTSFVLIFEVTKEGNFKGDQGWTHVVDQLVTVENYMMDSKGRYGVGECVIWDEGAKKYDPKRYESITQEETPTAEIPQSNDAAAAEKTVSFTF